MKISKFIVPFTFVALLLSAACAGADNVASCESFVDSLECGGSSIASVISCDTYEDFDCDVSDYFDCLAENTSCTNDTIDATNWTQCASKAQCD